MVGPRERPSISRVALLARLMLSTSGAEKRPSVEMRSRYPRGFRFPERAPVRWESARAALNVNERWDLAGPVLFLELGPESFSLPRTSSGNFDDLVDYACRCFPFHYKTGWIHAVLCNDVTKLLKA